MTAPAVAPAPAPVAPAAVRAPPQPPADAHAFAALIDSLPGAAATKTSASASESAPHPSNEPGQDKSPRGQPADRSLLSDGALLMSLPFALQAASMAEGPEDGDHATSLAPAATKEPGPRDSGASIAADAKPPTAARLIGERAFHFGVSASANGIASRTPATDAPFAPAGPVADVAPSFDKTQAAAPIAPRAGAPAINRLNSMRAAPHDAARGARKAEASAPPPAARAASSGAAGAPAESSGGGKAADGRPPDPMASGASPAPQADSLGAQLAPSFAAGASFGPDASTASAASADIAPRASTLAASPPPSAPPVREIDVDLSPGGLEDVSMTMRLAGDKLSVVIRAGSSQTLGSIEGARDAIADRLAAIGQPLDSLIVKQTGVNADGNGNGNAASADDGSAGETWRSAQGAGERGGSNDANSSRRSAHRDRGF